MAFVLKFVDRQNELDLLKAKWALTSNLENPSPQLVTLLGDRGRGKTRLALEFYNWLSTHFDGEGEKGFWPDTFKLIEHNMAVNIPFSDCNHNVPIPFIWWGIRLSDQSGENAATSQALQSYEPSLHGQMLADYLKRQAELRGASVAKVLVESGVEFATDALESVTFLKLAKGVFESVKIAAGKGVPNTGGNYNAYSETEKGLRERGQILLDDLRKVFNPSYGVGPISKEGKPKTPGVIFIDDAQFISEDLTFTHFIESLLHTVMTEKWPVMIIATHWRTEFLQQHEMKERSYAGIINHGLNKPESEKGPAAGKPGRFLNSSNMINMELGPLKASEGSPVPSDTGMHDLHLSGLKPCLLEILPGLTDEQVSSILERVDGNPRFLEQIIAEALSKPRRFVEHNTSRAMIDRGFSELMSKATSIEDVVFERLNSAPEEVRIALGLAAKQGLQFVQTYVETLSDELFGSQLTHGLLQAENPFSAINGARDPKQRILAFVEKLFLDAAREASLNLLDFSQKEQKIDLAMRNLLISRIEDEAFRQDETSDVRSLTYQLAINRFLDEDGPDWLIGLKALAWLIKDQEENYALLDASQNAEWFFDLVKNDIEIVCELDPWLVFTISALLRTLGSTGIEGSLALLNPVHQKLLRTKPEEVDTRLLAVVSAYVGDARMSQSQFKEAEAAFEESLSIIRPLMEQLKTPDSIRDVSVSLDRVGDARMAQSQFKEAEAAFEESLSIRRPLMEQLKTPQSIRDVSVSLIKVGDARMAQSQFKEAEAAFEESLSIRRPLMEQLKTPQSIRDVSVSLSKVGDARMAQSQFKEAEAAFEESLSIRRPLMEQLKTPDSIRDVSVSLSKVGDARMAQSQFKEAEAAFEESLSIIRPLMEQLKTPDSIRDVSVSLDRVGDARMAQSQFKEAEAAFEESLSIRRPLTEQLKTPQSIRDVSVSLSKVGDARMAQSQFKEAEAAFEESLSIRRPLMEQLKTPQSIRDVSVSLNKVGDARMAQSQFKEAEAAFEESLSIIRPLMEQLKTPQSIRDVSVSLSKVGDARMAQSQFKEAEAAFEESLSIIRPLMEQLKTPQSIRDVSVSLSKVGDARMAQSQFKEAEAAFEESLSIIRPLMEQLKTPQSIRDVSVSLDRVGDARMAQSQFKEAEAAFEESLSIIRPLMEQLKTPDSIRDVSVSLIKVGDARMAQSQFKEAEAAFEESLSIIRPLMEQLKTPDSIRDVSVSLDRVGDARMAQSQFKEAEAAFEESLSIRRPLMEQLKTPDSIRDVIVSLYKLLIFCLNVNNKPRAKTFLDEAMNLNKLLPEVYASPIQQALDEIEKHLD